MSRRSGWISVGLSLSLMAFIACGGGEAEQAGSGTGEMGSTPAAETAPAVDMQESVQLPEGVTAEMVSEGKVIYSGAGLCYVCHGPQGRGMPGLGASVVDAEWTHSDGSYEGIVATVMSGVEADKSTSGTAMPAKGGSDISDNQVKAVAAYVYSLSH